MLLLKLVANILQINFDTISGLLRYLEVEESSCLRQLKLNNCGMSGEIATAILCRIGKGRDMHLFLNSNHLETGSTDWIDLIQGDEVPKKLNLDMIEFKHEMNFDRLLKAMADNSTIEYLSLVGTGPPGHASATTSSLFANFLETNSTLQYLDFSGYSGKLEDAHLGWGLSGALTGLVQNESLRQLRIRNHDMGAAEDITKLCQVIAMNKGLAMLDMQNNNFDHHQLSRIVHALELNHRIISFPISDSDRDSAIAKEKQVFGKNIRKPFKGSLSRSDSAKLDGVLKWLKEHWDSETQKAESILQRNRDDYLNQALEFDTEFLKSWDDARLPSWLTRKPSNRDTTRQRDSTISRSSTISEVSISPTFAGNICSRPFGAASEPALDTYTIEEEESSPTTGYNSSPADTSPDGTGIPAADRNLTTLPRDHLWMKSHSRQRSYGTRKPS